MNCQRELHKLSVCQCELDHTDKDTAQMQSFENMVQIFRVPSKHKTC